MWKLYASQTTIHGVPEMLTSNTWMQRVFWMILFAVSASFGIYEISKIVDDFASNNIVTHVKIRPSGTFPSVMMQSKGPVEEKATIKYSEENFGVAMDLSGFFNAKMHHFCNGRKSGHREKRIEATDNETTLTVDLEKTQSDAVHSLKQVNLSDVAAKCHKGLAHQFKIQPEAVSSHLRIIANGQAHLLNIGALSSDGTFSLDITEFCVSNKENNDNGLKGINLAFGSAAESYAPGLETFHFIDCGRNHDILLKEKIVSRFPPYCTKETEATLIPCIHWCYLKRFDKTNPNHCIPYLGDATPEMPSHGYCNTGSEILGKCDSHTYQTCRDYCMTCDDCKPCDQKIVEPVIRSYETPRSSTEIKVWNCDPDNTLIIEQKPLFTWDTLVSNIGGLLGLCCGISLLSVVQFAFFWICNQRRRKKTEDPEYTMA